MGQIICKKCGIEAQEKILDRYEYEEGIPLCNVHTYECPNCQEFIFTEAQVEEIEKRTEMIKSEMLAFERKVTVSGRSLVINLPEDLVRHMNIAKGKIVKIIPGGKKKFIVEV